MVFARWIFGLFLFSLLLAGCAQPSPAASPTPVASAASPTPSVPAVSSSPSATASAASPTARIPYIPSVKPSELPSSTPVATEAPAGVPGLAEFVPAFNAASNRAFNDSKIAYQSATDFWAIDNTTADYAYTVYIQNSKARYFSSFDVVRTVYGASGLAKNASVTEGETGPYYKYTALMKCYDARYDVEVTVKDFTHVPGSSAYRRTLGPSVMLTFVDACPN